MRPRMCLKIAFLQAVAIHLVDVRTHSEANKNAALIDDSMRAFLHISIPFYICYTKTPWSILWLIKSYWMPDTEVWNPAPSITAATKRMMRSG